DWIGARGAANLCLWLACQERRPPPAVTLGCLHLPPCADRGAVVSRHDGPRSCFRAAFLHRTPPATLLHGRLPRQSDLVLRARPIDRLLAVVPVVDSRVPFSVQPLANGRSGALPGSWLSAALGRLVRAFLFAVARQAAALHRARAAGAGPRARRLLALRPGA